MRIVFPGRESKIRIWLLIAGFAVIVAINVLLAFTFSRSIADRIILHEGEISRDFLNGIANAGDNSEELFATAAPSPALLSFSSHLRDLPGVVRANVYSLDGYTRYSTESNLIGLKFHDNEELARAGGGEIIVGIKAATDEDKPEYLALRRLSGEQMIEAYIPVSDAKGKVIAVVEFYKKPDALNATIAGVTRYLWQIAAFSGLVMLLAFYGAIARVNIPTYKDPGVVP